MKILLMALIIIVLISLGFAISNQQTIGNKQACVFENSNFVYVEDMGFITKDYFEVLKKQEFTERSREYFLNELKK